MDDLLGDLASRWAIFSEWLFPSIWLLVGLFAFRSNTRLAALLLVLAGASGLLFNYLFAPYSWFTEGWETDAPLSVSFSYKPVGFLAANLLPSVSHGALILALIFLVWRRG
jgi:hypothetical protein